MILSTALTSVSVWLSKPLFRGIIALLLALSCQPGRADTIYQTQDDFLKEVFPNKVAGEDIKPAVLWLDKKAQEDIGKILGHPYPQARLRYWRKNDTSVWILDEVGNHTHSSSRGRGHRSRADLERPRCESGKFGDA